jgi:hypothetical protein
VAYGRTVKTASGATAVQIVHAKRRGARRIEHVGSAHDEQELQALKTAAAQRLGLEWLALWRTTANAAAPHRAAQPVGTGNQGSDTLAAPNARGAEHREP